MCLTWKYTDEEKKEWLKNKPEMITAYKRVRIRALKNQKKMFPLFMFPLVEYKHFERNNLLKTIKSKKSKKYKDVYCQSRCYMAYFHLFEKKSDAKSFLNRPYGTKLVKCVVPKKYITDVGLQGGTVIVTRKFSIVGEDEYLS